MYIRREHTGADQYFVLTAMGEQSINKVNMHGDRTNPSSSILIKKQIVNYFIQNYVLFHACSGSELENK